MLLYGWMALHCISRRMKRAMRSMTIFMVDLTREIGEQDEDFPKPWYRYLFNLIGGVGTRDRWAGKVYYNEM